jgi:hypothetical protein
MEAKKLNEYFWESNHYKSIIVVVKNVYFKKNTSRGRKKITWWLLNYVKRRIIYGNDAWGLIRRNAFSFHALKIPEDIGGGYTR